jgi:hypothetical protein
MAMSTPTLQELTLAHSQRLSDVYRTRDVQAAGAQASRDRQLRTLPAAAKMLQKYDAEVAAAREKQLATDAKAAAARTSALLTAVDRRADRLEDAQLGRRSADVAAVIGKRQAEDAAEAKYLAALTGARDMNDTQRARAIHDAERTRHLEIDQARRGHDQALSTSQQHYRAAVDDAVLAERRDGRDGERAYLDAIRFSEAAAHAARVAADQNLQAALAGLDAARDILRGWRAQLAAIKTETAKAEQEEFSRFRRELQELKFPIS